MAAFLKDGTIADFQAFNHVVYGRIDDRYYATWDLLNQQQRFTMRALKGIRKRDTEKLKLNLLVSMSFLMAIANRFHINVEEEMWRRFPTLCSYCGKHICACKTIKPRNRKEVVIDNRLRPKNMLGFQKMFAKIYPPAKRTLADAGVHLAEEAGEVSEAIHNFIGQHKMRQLEDIKLEIADYLSCLFGVANSAKINVAGELARMFKNNCHVCHKAPCTCTFASVTRYRS